MAIGSKFAAKQGYKYALKHPETVTEEIVEYLEQQGFDVTELRKKVTKLKVEEEKTNETHLDRLNSYRVVPRDVDTDFISLVGGKAPRIGRGKWENTYANAPLVYAQIVQAHSALHKVGNTNNAGVVVVVALGSNMYNEEFLSSVAKEIYQMKNVNDVPEDMKKLIGKLRDNTSSFCFPVGKSVVGDADVWCATYAVEKQTDLPNNYLPDNGTLPCLLLDSPKENRFIELKLIPSNFYR